MHRYKQKRGMESEYRVIAGIGVGGLPYLYDDNGKILDENQEFNIKTRDIIKQEIKKEDYELKANNRLENEPVIVEIDINDILNKSPKNDEQENKTEEELEPENEEKQEYESDYEKEIKDLMNEKLPIININYKIKDKEHEDNDRCTPELIQDNFPEFKNEIPIIRLSPNEERFSPINLPVHNNVDIDLPIKIKNWNHYDIDDNIDFFKSDVEKNAILKELTYYNKEKIRNNKNYNYEFNKIIIENNKTIYCQNKKKKIKVSEIPNVDKLIITPKFNHKIKKNTIPQSLKELIFVRQWHTLKILGDSFNKNIEKDALPESIEKIEFSDDFNQEFVISSKYKNKNELISVIPSSLKELILGNAYNREFTQDSLPDTLLKLETGNVFNKKIRYLPPNLTHLELGKGYRHVFKENDLPKTLTSLILGDEYEQEFKKGVLPTNLTLFKIGDMYNCEFRKGVLPETIEILDLGNNYDFEFQKEVLPKNLKVLKLGNSYNRKFFKGILPNNLKELYLGDSYDQIFELGVLPDSLEVLHLGYAYNVKFNKGVLPKNLKILKFGNDYDQVFEENVLPKKLVELYLGVFYNQIFEANILPDTIEIFELGEKYSHSIKEDNYPKNINHIIICGSEDNKKVLNGLPYLNKLTLKNLKFQLNNLPISIQEIFIKTEEQKKFLTKIPFDCKIKLFTEE